MVRSWSPGSPRTMIPPTAPQPKPSTESCIPVRPKTRNCIAVPPTTCTIFQSSSTVLQTVLAQLLTQKRRFGERPRSAKVASNDERTSCVLGRKKRKGESMGRKIAIVGTGAVGGYVGAHMVQAGEDVTFIDP